MISLPNFISIIVEDTVITAAHCFERKDVENIKNKMKKKKKKKKFDICKLHLNLFSICNFRKKTISGSGCGENFDFKIRPGLGEHNSLDCKYIQVLQENKQLVTSLNGHLL